jgi:hypothetical protein
MQQATVPNGNKLASAIKRQASTAALRRYAASLPLYTVTRDLPDYFTEMLAKLEAAERRRVSPTPVGVATNIFRPHSPPWPTAGNRGADRRDALFQALQQQRVGNLEFIEPNPQHVRQLIDQYLPDRSHRSVKAIAAAQISAFEKLRPSLKAGKDRAINARSPSKSAIVSTGSPGISRTPSRALALPRVCASSPSTTCRGRMTLLFEISASAFAVPPFVVAKSLRRPQARFRRCRFSHKPRNLF